MTYKYRINIEENNDPKIEKVEFKDEPGNLMYALRGFEGYEYFDTWKEAQDFIVQNIQKEITMLKKILIRKTGNLKKAQALIEE